MQPGNLGPDQPILLHDQIKALLYYSLQPCYSKYMFVIISESVSSDVSHFRLQIIMLMISGAHKTTTMLLLRLFPILLQVEIQMK